MSLFKRFVNICTVMDRIIFHFLFDSVLNLFSMFYLYKCLYSVMYSEVKLPSCPSLVTFTLGHNCVMNFNKSLWKSVKLKTKECWKTCTPNVLLFSVVLVCHGTALTVTVRTRFLLTVMAFFKRD